MKMEIDPAVLNLLGGASRETKRTEAEINETLVLIPKSCRSALKGQDRINFISRVTSGISQYKFALRYNGNKTELDDVYSLALRVRTFREDCRNHDINDIFEILPFNESGQLARVATEPTTSLSTPSSSSSSSLSMSQQTKPRNLFDNYKDVSLEMVKKSTRFYYEHSTQDYIIENIVWSGEKLINSCTPELRDMILQKALFLPQKEVGGPVYFKIMMDIYHDVSSKARTSPTEKREKYFFDPPSPEGSSLSTRMKKELKAVTPSLKLSNLDE